MFLDIIYKSGGVEMVVTSYKYFSIFSFDYESYSQFFGNGNGNTWNDKLTKYGFFLIQIAYVGWVFLKGSKLYMVMDIVTLLCN